MENNEGLMLQFDEDGVVSIYEEPYASIEIKTEEDYIQFEKLMQLGNKLTQLDNSGLKTILTKVRTEMENSFDNEINSNTSLQEARQHTDELKKSIEVMKAIIDLITLQKTGS